MTLVELEDDPDELDAGVPSLEGDDEVEPMEDACAKQELHTVTASLSQPPVPEFPSICTFTVPRLDTSNNANSLKDSSLQLSRSIV
ncbi:MAG: hypothetical protein FRX49_04568 [Trebouxia sp. A1-2]|nr:MAG: hypothetical protein FRX49_04568 [Trebouxia sp. A1-2]